jgi:EpsG family
MWPYWLMLLLAVLGVIGTPKNADSHITGWILSALAVAYVFLIGFRFNVGGDWGSYLSHFYATQYLTFWDALLGEDPGYYVLNWIVYNLGGSIFWVNTVCAAIVMAGVNAFARRQPYPLLAVVVAVPYLLMVVAMGYSRQSAALGFCMIALAALGNNEVRKFALLVICGALFHKSAVLLLPIAALSTSSNRLWTATWVGIVALLGAYLLVSDSVDRLWENYVEADYQSEGGLIRVLMNVLPALLLLYFRDRLFYTLDERRLWTWMAIFSLVALPLVMLSSTAIDRVALYFIPIQMFTYSRLPYLLPSGDELNIVVWGVLGYAAAVMFVWLNYAGHAHAWLPYKNYFFI